MIEAEIEEIKIDMEVMIPSEDVMVTVTEDGYVKRSSVRSYSASNGEPPGMKDTDSLLMASQLNTTETLLMFTNKGNYIYLPVYEMPEIRWKDMGQHLASLVGLDKDEKLIKAYPIKDFAEDQYLIFFTKQGMAKKTELKAYKASRYNRPLMAVKLKAEDEVVDVSLTNGKQDVFITTHFGLGLWFAEEEISIVGQRASGVKGINLKAGDHVVSGFALPEDPEKAQVIIATQRGALKKMKVSEFDKTSRAKRGLVMVRELKSNPHRIVGMKLVSEDETHFVLETKSGKEETISALNYKPADRYNNGSFVVDTGETGLITRIKLLVSTEQTKE